MNNDGLTTSNFWLALLAYV